MTTKLKCSVCGHVGEDVANYYIGGKGDAPYCVGECQETYVCPCNLFFSEKPDCDYDNSTAFCSMVCQPPPTLEGLNNIVDKIRKLVNQLREGRR